MYLIINWAEADKLSSTASHKQVVFNKEKLLLQIVGETVQQQVIRI